LQLFDSPEQAIAALIVLAVLLLVAFPIHEFSHALAAYRLGDSTARLFGRLTLNPAAHFDPAGGLILALSIILSGGSFGFGWAKPTPVNPANLRGGRRGDALVALAGPLSNLVLAIAAALPIRYLIATGFEPPAIVAQILISFFSINLALMIFNLIPIPPLDGSHVLFALLDPPTAWRVRAFLTQYGTLILMVAVFLPIFPGNATLIRLVFDVIGRPLASILLGT
jgi:Zn-dependent protease